MKGQRVGHEEWESVVEEDNPRGFEVLEGQIRWLKKRIEELENDRKREEDWKMARAGWLSGTDRGIWLGSKGRNERERRKRERQERRQEWESSDEDSEDGRYVSSKETVRELVEKIGGSEGGSGTFEEKRRNRGSSSEGDEGNKKWRWDGENWWHKVEHQAAVHARLRRRISRLVKSTLEQEDKRRIEGGGGHPSKIEIENRVDGSNEAIGIAAEQIEDEWWIR